MIWEADKGRLPSTLNKERKHSKSKNGMDPKLRQHTRHECSHLRDWRGLLSNPARHRMAGKATTINCHIFSRTRQGLITSKYIGSGNCQKTFRYLLRFYSLLFRGFFVALFCLEKQCSGLFVTFSWFFRVFFVAPVLGKFYAYSPWNSLLKLDVNIYIYIFIYCVVLVL